MQKNLQNTKNIVNSNSIMKYLDGINVTKVLKEDLKNEVLKLKTDPYLAVIQVGEDPASSIYVKKKQEAAFEIGIEFTKISFHEETDEEIVVEKIRELNDNDSIQGILVQLPLPKWLNKERITNEINPDKDVDGFHPENIKKILNDQANIYPPVANSIMKLLDVTKQDLKNKKAAVLVNSDEFFVPLEYLLKKKGIIPTKISPTDTEIEKITLESDILISARGTPRWIKAEMVKPGAILIDVGITRLEGKVIGDIDKTAYEKASFVTPVPGGVGPVTVAMLIKNVILLTSLKEKKE